MAYGDTPYDESLKKAWGDFCERLRAAGDLVFQDPAPATALDRAAGFQYLSQNISLGLDKGFEHADPLFPQLFRNMTPTRKYGGDNPDCIYLQATVDGAQTYRIVGNMGTAQYIVFSAYRGDGHGGIRTAVENLKPGVSSEVAKLLKHEVRTDWDGNFELFLSPDEQQGNWIKTTPDTKRLLIRQFFAAWDEERPMNARIERVGAGDEVPPPLTPERLVEGLREGAEWVPSTAHYWREWQERYRPHPNTFQTSGTQSRVGAAPGGVTQHCYWMVQPDEALVIEVIPPRARFWNFEFNNYWMCSVDYRYRLSTTNSKHAVLEEDGSLRIVIAHSDPGVPNWLDAAGHCEGRLGLRWMQADGAPVPATRLVKLADLDRQIPANTRRITPDERREQLRRRKIGVDRRFRV